MMRLLVISNHNPENWTEEQRYGWDEILYHPFPEVEPSMSRLDIENELIPVLKRVIDNFIYDCHKTNSIPYVNLQGEYTLSMLLYQIYKDKVMFVFPTTKREVREIKLEDGSVKKEAVFKFVRWR